MQAFMHCRQQAYFRIASLRLMFAIAALIGIVLLRIAFPGAAASIQSTTAKTALSSGAATRLPITAPSIVLIDL